MFNRYFQSKPCRSFSLGVAVFVGAANALAVFLEPQTGLANVVCTNPFTPEYEAQIRSEAAAIAREMQGGPFHKALHMMTDFPAVDEPTIHAADETDLPETTAVISIEVDGQPFAFVPDRMLNPRDHILNLSRNRQQVSVTYCPLVDCVRVLSDESERPIPLQVGGLDIDTQMVFLLNGVRYGQESPDLPLADYPFARMKFGEWKHQNPHGQVCLPPVLN